MCLVIAQMTGLLMGHDSFPEKKMCLVIAQMTGLLLGHDSFPEKKNVFGHSTEDWLIDGP